MQIGLGMVVLAVWGTTLLQGLVPEDGISWQGHLFGALGGVLAARLLQRADRDPRRARRRSRPLTRADAFPLGAAVTLAELDADPHPVLARLRAAEPVSWVPALGGWLVTRRDLAMQVMRDPETFTVDDERFSTGQVVGPSMLSLDGESTGATARRSPSRSGSTRCASASPSRCAEETDRLLDAVADAGEAELRRELAGPLAAAIVTHALGLRDAGTAEVLAWYDAIVASVTEITAGTRADGGRRARLRRAARGDGARAASARRQLAARRAASEAAGLGHDEVISNAAVMLFGGIETTEGMIANAIAHLLSHPEAARRGAGRPALLANAIEESLRLEPAAAVVDRYSTRRPELAGAAIGARELVVVSIAGANRDPEVFPDPDRFDVRRENARLHAAFAGGPHVCIGMHLARLEAHTAVAAGARAAARPGPRRAPVRAASCSASRTPCACAGRRPPSARLPPVLIVGIVILVVGIADFIVAAVLTRQATASSGLGGSAALAGGADPAPPGAVHVVVGAVS